MVSPGRALAFAAARRAMLTDLVAPALDPDQPASLSSTVVTDLLKQTLGFDGVVLSDDLGMKAIAATMPLVEAAPSAVVAGCDAVLLCNSTADEQVGALEALIHAAESGRLTPQRIDDAFRRQLGVKTRIRPSLAAPAVPLDLVGSRAHQAIAEEMAAWR